MADLRAAREDAYWRHWRKSLRENPRDGLPPRWLALRLARYALRKTPYIRLDWQTVRVTGTEQPGRFTWRFQFAFWRIRSA